MSFPTLWLVSIDHELGIQAARIAASHRLRGADALYAAVANRLQIPLVSWDQEQIEQTAGLIATYTPSHEV